MHFVDAHVSGEALGLQDTRRPLSPQLLDFGDNEATPIITYDPVGQCKPTRLGVQRKLFHHIPAASMVRCALEAYSDCTPAGRARQLPQFVVLRGPLLGRPLSA